MRVASLPPSEVAARLIDSCLSGNHRPGPSRECHTSAKLACDEEFALQEQNDQCAKERSSSRAELWRNPTRCTRLWTVRQSCKTRSRTWTPDMELTASRVLLHSSRHKNLLAMRETVRANNLKRRQLQLHTGLTVSYVIRIAQATVWCIQALPTTPSAMMTRRGLVDPKVSGAQLGNGVAAFIGINMDLLYIPRFS